MLVRDRRILSYGFRKKLIADKPWEISAVYDALFGARIDDLSGSYLFTTAFPDQQDMILIVSVGIASLHYLGKIEDMAAVQIANSLAEAKVPMEVVHMVEA